jgi:4-amino-4-deoxy-L-arabinose transferase-like glycosyltransferase
VKLQAFVRATWPPALVLGGLAAMHLCFSPVGEPFKNGDETRHVMTGVFVRDALTDLPASASDPRGYASRYYLQYPALGIIIWPPFFYLVEGVAMWAFGTSYLVARLVAYAFALVGGVYAYRLFCRTHDRPTALFALGVLGLAPLVFEYSSYVLLEVPTLALVLAAVFHFERYLSGERARDAVLACLLAALAALTRFDGVLLLPFALLRLGFTRRFALLFRWPVLGGLLLALLLTVPYYLFTWKVYGSGIQHAATTGTGKQATSWLDPRNFYLYPSYLPAQVGWAATAAAVVGLGHALWADRKRAGVYLALAAATYLTFAPLAEPEPRHAIYWVPAFALFAVQGAGLVTRIRPWLGPVACGLLLALVGGATVWSLRETGWQGVYVEGTDRAAEVVLARAAGERPLLYDGQLNGAFISFVRRRDPDRKMTVVRADKLLYSVHSDPRGGYEEYAKTDAEAVALLHRYDPEYIVVEENQVYFETTAGDRLRRVLREHPDEYALEEAIPFRTNYPNFAANRLLVYRKVRVNPERTPVTELPVMAIGGTVTAK